MLLGIDGNWYLHRIFHTQKFEAKDPATNMARRFMGMICKDALAVRATNLFVAFDGNRVFRYALDPEYKANRDRDKSGPGPYDHIDGLFDYIAYCGIQCVQRPLYEADDLLASLATQNENVVVGCRDKDALQYVLRPDIRLYDSSFKVKVGGKLVPRPRMTTGKDVKDQFGVPPRLALDLQTLMGDRIDNIPQIVPRAEAIRGLTEHGSIKAWVAADRDFRRLVKKRVDDLKLNRKLVRLLTNLPIEVKPVKWNKDVEMVKAYIEWREFCNPKSRGLF